MTPHDWNRIHFLPDRTGRQESEHWEFTCRRCGHEIIAISENYVPKPDDMKYWDCDEEVVNKVHAE